MKPGALFLDLLLFGATLVLAVHQSWSVTDLVWSLWISSLVLGYTFLLVPIAAMVLKGDPGEMMGEGTKMKGADGPPAIRALPMNIFVLIVAFFMIGFSWVTFWIVLLVAVSTLLGVGGMLRERPGWTWCPDPNDFFARILILLPFALFLFGFFTVHFVGFHFVHSIFLNGFFPVIEASPSGKTIEGTFFYFLTLARTSFHLYWPFVAFSALSRLPDYVAAWQGRVKDVMSKPYLNVIRMHVMIFVFAFAAAAGLKNALLYPLLILYFFPFGSIIRLLSRGEEAEVEVRAERD